MDVFGEGTTFPASVNGSLWMALRYVPVLCNWYFPDDSSHDVLRMLQVCVVLSA